MAFLIDTCVLSELGRPRPDAGVVRWMGGQTQVVVSAITLEELCFGLAWRPHERVQAWLDRFKDTWEVIPIDRAIASVAGVLRGELQARGQTRTPSDMLIAASAIATGRTLVTRNLRDFRGCGVALLDPFLG